MVNMMFAAAAHSRCTLRRLAHHHHRPPPLLQQTVRSYIPEPPAPPDRPFLHHGQRLRFRQNPKFKSPRKKANILIHELEQESMQRSIAAKPAVFETDFKVGDAIEIEHVEQGGAKATKTERIRGVLLGIFRKRIDYTVLIRDVVFGEPVETLVPLHSPMVRSVKVLEHNFVKKGKKRIKRAKLYYLRDRNPLDCRVTKW